MTVKGKVFAVPDLMPVSKYMIQFAVVTAIPMAMDVWLRQPELMWLSKGNAGTPIVTMDQP